MSSDQPSREQIEARITALLLGELPEDEASLLRYTIAQDPALKALHDELQATLVLVREAAKHSEEPVEKAAPLKLSAERREKLLAHFKTGRTKTTTGTEETPKTPAARDPLFWLRRIQLPSEKLIVAAVVILMVIGIVSISIPNFVKARATSQSHALINNLRQIDAAKEEWAVENHKSASDVPTAADLTPYLAKGIPRPVMGETYVLGRVSEPATVDNETKRQLAARSQETALKGLQFGTWGAENEKRHSVQVVTGSLDTNAFTLMADSTAQSTSETLTVAPESRLAPPAAVPTPNTIPSTQIVLPKTDSTTEVAAKTAPSQTANNAGQFATQTAESEAVLRQAALVPSNGTDNDGKLGAVAGTTFAFNGIGVGGVSVNNRPPLTPPVQAAPPPVTATLPAPAGSGQTTLNYDTPDLTPDIKMNTSGSIPSWQDRSKQAENQTVVPGHGLLDSSDAAATGTSSSKNNGTVAGVANGYVSTGAFTATAGGGGAGLGGTALPYTTGSTFAERPTEPPPQPAPVAAPPTVATHNITEEQRLPGVSSAAAEDEAYERSLIEAQKKHEAEQFKRNENNNGFFALTEPATAMPATETFAPNDLSDAGAKRSAGGYPSSRGGHALPAHKPAGERTEVPAAPLPAPAVASLAPPPPLPAAGIISADGTEYTIVSGDTLSKIARKNGVSLKALEEANPGVEPKKLRPGRSLVIPDATAPAMAERTPAAGTLALDEPQRHGEDDNERLHYVITNSAALPSPAHANHFVGRYAYTITTPIEFDRIHSTNAIAMSDRRDSTFGSATAAVPSGGNKQEEMIEPGLINFEGTDLSQVLDIYSKLTHRTVLRSSLPQAQINLDMPQAPLAKSKAIEAVQAALAINGVSLVNVGDKFAKVVPSDQAGSSGGEIDKSGSRNIPPSGSYITHVVQLKYVKPSEMAKVIQPFAKSGSIIPLDSSGILVVRDSAENVQRMSKMINTVDVSPPAEYVSEVIPIRYAKVDDIANALEAFGNGAGSNRLFGQTKIIPNEASSSLLIYATRPDMDVIKNLVVKLDTEKTDLPIRKPSANAPIPQPEILTRENNFSTFAMNVSDVSFKFAEASLQNGKLPDTASIRSEEFINAFDYRDPEALAGQPMAFASERARYPFAHNRELLRFAIKTAAAGRQEGRALNLVLLLDNSGSMERADRVAIIREALRVLAAQLQPQDTVSVVTFSRTARLWADGISGDKAGETFDRIGGITPEGGTNLEEAMRLAYETAHRHYIPNGMNRVVLLTDGAANLGNVEPDALKHTVEVQRKQGIALDCFGIGWEDFNDDLLELLSSNGDGRYAFLNSPEDATKDFAAKLAGALQITAADLKVQVEFNPERVISYRQIGYAKHQLTKEQFRDNTVAAGEIAAQEAGNALYTIETNPGGEGPIATVYVRYRVPGTSDYRELSWDVPYTGTAPALDKSSSAMRLAAVASAFSEWLAASPYAQGVTLDELLKYLNGVPEVYGADDRPKQLETMIQEAKSLEGK